MSDQPEPTISRRAFGTGALGFAGALFLASCARSGASTSGGGGGTAAYANKSMDFFFFVVQSQAVQRKTKQLGYTFQTSNANSDSSTQYNDINSFLLQKPALLISDPIDSKGLAPLAQKARNAKVPFGIIDTPLTKGVVDFTIAFDNYKGGQMAAQKIVDALGKRYGKPRGTVLNAYGALSSSAWLARKEGFEAVLKQYPGVTVISRPTNGDESAARSIAQATLAQYPQLDAAHAPSDSITRGIVTTLRGQNLALPKDNPKHVILTSIDGEPQSLGWIREGILDAEVSQDPVAYGEICVEMLNKYTAKGKAVPAGEYRNSSYYWQTAPIKQTPNGPSCVIPPYYIDAANVSDPRQWGNVVTKEWGLKQS